MQSTLKRALKRFKRYLFRFEFSRKQKIHDNDHPINFDEVLAISPPPNGKVLSFFRDNNFQNYR